MLLSQGDEGGFNGILLREWILMAQNSLFIETSGLLGFVRDRAVRENGSRITSAGYTF